MGNRSVLLSDYLIITKVIELQCLCLTVSYLNLNYEKALTQYLPPITQFLFTKVRPVIYIKLKNKLSYSYVNSGQGGFPFLECDEGFYYTPLFYSINIF